MGLAPSAGLLRGQHLLGHLSDHVVQDASIMEVSELHVGVEPHHSLEGLPGVQLQGQRGRAALKAGWTGTPALGRLHWGAAAHWPQWVWDMAAVPAADGTSGLCAQREPWGFMCPLEVGKCCRINDAGEREQNGLSGQQLRVLSRVLSRHCDAFPGLFWTCSVPAARPVSSRDLSSRLCSAKSSGDSGTGYFILASPEDINLYIS